MATATVLLAGRYQLDEPIGTGGYCQVWRATDTVLTRAVAVKLPHAGYAQQAEIPGRFKAERNMPGPCPIRISRGCTTTASLPKGSRLIWSWS
jgi:serine/threonine protein kinase